MNECYWGTQNRKMYLRATGDYLEKPSFSYLHWINLSNEFGLRGFVSRSLHASKRVSKEGSLLNKVSAKEMCNQLELLFLINCWIWFSCSLICIQSKEQSMVGDPILHEMASSYRLFFLRSIAQFFTKITWIVLSVHNLNKLGKFW